MDLNTPRTDDECWLEEGVGDLGSCEVIVEERKFRAMIYSKKLEKKVPMMVEQYFIHLKRESGGTETFKVYRHLGEYRYTCTSWENAKDQGLEVRFDSPAKCRYEFVRYLAGSTGLTPAEASEFVREYTGH